MCADPFVSLLDTALTSALCLCFTLLVILPLLHHCSRKLETQQILCADKKKIHRGSNTGRWKSLSEGFVLLRTADCQAPPASLSRPLGLRALLLATAEAKSEYKDKYKSTITMTITKTETKTNKQLTQQPASKLDRLPRLPLGAKSGPPDSENRCHPTLVRTLRIADRHSWPTYKKRQIVHAKIEHILNLRNPEMEKTKVF